MDIEGVKVPKCETFHCLGSIIQKNGFIGEDVDHRIKAGWTKWRMTSRVLSDRRMPTKLKWKCYNCSTSYALWFRMLGYYEITYA